MKNTVTHVVKFRIDERSLSEKQLESFMRHAGTSRAAWNQALGRYTEFFDRQKEYIHNKSLVDSQGDIDKALELRKDKNPHRYRVGGGGPALSYFGD